MIYFLAYSIPATSLNLTLIYLSETILLVDFLPIMVLIEIPFLDLISILIAIIKKIAQETYDKIAS